MKISYECSKLISELKEDMEEFGDVDMYACYEAVKGYTFLTNYDFLEEEMPIEKEELEQYKEVKVMKASEILAILEEQNRIL